MNDIIHINVILDSGGIGDSICRLTPINFILKYHPNIIIHLIVPDFFKEFASRCFDSKSVIVKSITDIRNKPKLYNTKSATYAFAKYETRLNNLACHMVDHAFFIMNFQPTDPHDRNYPKVNITDIDVTRFALPEKYAVIATGFTSEVREFLPKHVNQVTQFLFDQGITPVFVGNSGSANGAGHVIAPTFKEEIDFSKGINLIDQTSLLETVKIIQGSKLIVGLDCGVNHLAGCVDEVPIVMGFTTVLKEHRMPVRKGITGYNVFPVTLTKEELDCIGCQSKMPFAYGHKFTQCFMKHKKCLDLLSGDKYIEQIKKITGIQGSLSTT